MNTEHLHELLRAVEADLNETRSLDQLEGLRSALERWVDSPQAPEHQQHVVAARVDLITSLEGADSNSFSPAWKAELSELGVADLLGVRLAERVLGAFISNEITPSGALEAVRVLEEELREIESSVRQTNIAFDRFGIESDVLVGDDCAITYTMPRAAIEDQLRVFESEVKVLRQIVGPFAELTGYPPDDIRLDRISSSDFKLQLFSHPITAAAVAVAVEKAIAAYKSTLEIRVLRRKLKETDVLTDGLSDQIDARIEEKVLESSRSIALEVVEEFASEDVELGRRNELTTAVGKAVDALTARIDHGFELSIRCAPVDGEGAQEGGNQSNQYLSKIRELEPRIRYDSLDGGPLLHLEKPDDDAPGDAEAADSE